jgi:general secretion pathway protein B
VVTPALAPAASAPPAHVPTLAELPESTRASLPALTLGGTVYANVAAQRLVVLNGQVFHQGDQPIAGLVVKEIRPRSVVLSYRGQAFELVP